MTLGPKFYTKLVLPPKCYFCFVNPQFRCGSAPFYLYIPVPISKHDLKHFSKHNTLHWDRISNFFIVLPPKCYFCFVNPWFRCGSAPFYLYIPVLVPKHYLKRFSKSDMFGFTGGAFMDLKCVFNDSEMLFIDFEMFCLWFWKAV